MGSIAKKTASLKRGGRSRLSFAWVVVFLLVAIMLSIQMVSLQAFDKSSGGIHVEENEYPVVSSTCPDTLTKEECQQRLVEFRAQLVVEEEIRNEVAQNARERAKYNVYQRQQPQRLQQEHEQYFQKVQAAATASPDSDYAAWKNFSGNSFADLSIVGFPKAGTSHLYKLIMSHPDTSSIFKRKEFCMDHNHFLDYTSPKHRSKERLHGLHKKLFHYHRHLLKKRNEPVPPGTSKPQLVNACLQTTELEYHIAYSPLPPAAKFLLLFRDPADWLWASWNFWIDKQLDSRPSVDHDWATVGVQYRSPELFHELVLSQEASNSAAHRFRSMRENTVHVPRRLLHLVGRDRLVVIQSETMTDGVDSFLQELADRTGLDAKHFDRNVAQGRTNCNAHKGYQNLCNASSTNNVRTSSGAYEITHYRPMLQATRELIYMQFWEECKVWAEEFGIVYRACLQSVTQ